MKSLILVRHATATDREANITDFDRSLVKKGEKESKKMAGQFLFHQMKPDIWVSSPAPRALETAYIFADVLDYSRDNILQEDTLYHENSSETYIDLTHSLPNDKNSVIYFGHEPAISEFAAYLVKNLHLDFPKAGVLGVKVMVDSWKSLSEGEGYVFLIEFARSGKEISKILDKNLAAFIYHQNDALLASLTPKINRKMQKSIKNYSTKISKLLAKRQKKK